MLNRLIILLPILIFLLLPLI
ncbi:Protein of unknown function [Streptococcus thermophilus]|nr:Protein of unknown function [Streptococcus thermophilus]